MKWPWQKKSVFDCSFYDKNTTKEAMNKINETVDSIFENFDKAKEKPKEEKKEMSESIIVRRGTSETFAERLTNRKFGLNIDYTASTDTATLPVETMMVAVLMDIRERLDTLIELSHKKAKGKTEKKTVKTTKTKGEK